LQSQQIALDPTRQAHKSSSDASCARMVLFPPSQPIADLANPTRRSLCAGDCVRRFSRGRGGYHAPLLFPYEQVAKSVRFLPTRPVSRTCVGSVPPSRARTSSTLPSRKNVRFPKRPWARRQESRIRQYLRSWLPKACSDAMSSPIQYTSRRCQGAISDRYLVPRLGPPVNLFSPFSLDTRSARTRSRNVGGLACLQRPFSPLQTRFDIRFKLNNR
jgi:hypothetical protein